MLNHKRKTPGYLMRKRILKESLLFLICAFLPALKNHKIFSSNDEKENIKCH